MKRFFLLCLCVLVCGFASSAHADKVDEQIKLVQAHFNFKDGGIPIPSLMLKAVLLSPVAPKSKTTFLDQALAISNMDALRNKYDRGQFLDGNIHITDDMLMAIIEPPDLPSLSFKDLVLKAGIARTDRSFSGYKAAYDKLGNLYSSAARIAAIQKLLSEVTRWKNSVGMNKVIREYRAYGANSGDSNEDSFWSNEGFRVAADRFSAGGVGSGRTFVEQTSATYDYLLSSQVKSDAVTFRFKVNEAIKNFNYPIVSVADASVREGNLGMTNMIFKLSLSAPWAVPTIINYNTRPGTARANEDFTATRGTLTLLPNVKSTTISIPVRGDLIDEDNETFFLDWIASHNMVEAKSTKGIIIDDDTLALSITDASVKEGNRGTTHLDFKISLSAPAPANLSLVCVTSDRTTKAGEDYRPNPVPVRINRGQFSGVFSILVNGDTLVEPDETFFVRLAPTTYKINKGTATGTILNDDQDTPTPTSQSTSYITFYGDELKLYPWEGRNVAVLTATSKLDSGVMARIVEVCDATYDYYKAVTGRVPSVGKQFNGKSTVAEVSSACGGAAACGYSGFTGIEMQTTYFDVLYNQIKQNNLYDQVVFYEFGRNFWFYGDQIEYIGEDSNGVVSTGFAVYMRFKAMRSVNAAGAPFNGNSFSSFEEAVRSLVDTYEADTSLNWANTLRIYKAPPNDLGLNGTDLFASFCMRLERDYGGEEFTRKLWKEVEKRPKANTTTEALRNFVDAASTAAGQDLTPLFRDQWRWPLGQAQSPSRALLDPSAPGS